MKIIASTPLPDVLRVLGCDYLLSPEEIAGIAGIQITREGTVGITAHVVVERAGSKSVLVELCDATGDGWVRIPPSAD